MMEVDREALVERVAELRAERERLREEAQGRVAAVEGELRGLVMGTNVALGRLTGMIEALEGLLEG